RRPIPAGLDADPHSRARGRETQRVVDQDAYDARDGTGVSRCPRRRRYIERDIHTLTTRTCLELRRHRARELAELDPLAAQLELCVEAREVQQVGGQARQPGRLRAGAVELATRVVDIRRLTVQV